MYSGTSKYRKHVPDIAYIFSSSKLTSQRFPAVGLLLDWEIPLPHVMIATTFGRGYKYLDVPTPLIYLYELTVITIIARIS